MKGMFSLVSLILFLIVGLICFFMAYTTMFSKKYLPFHEQASGKKWEELGSSLQATILTLLKLSGLGFLTVGLLITVFPIINSIHPDLLTMVAMTALALIFCFGLFIFNFRLHRKTNADTPWKGSLFAMVIIVMGFVLSLFGVK